MDYRPLTKKVFMTLVYLEDAGIHNDLQIYKRLLYRVSQNLYLTALKLWHRID